MPHVVKKCEQCQRSFGTYSPTARFCSRRCYAASGADRGPGCGHRDRDLQVVRETVRGQSRAEAQSLQPMVGVSRTPACGAEGTVVFRLDEYDTPRRGIQSPCLRCLGEPIPDLSKVGVVFGISPGLVFRRKDKRIGYSPKNCGWATRVQFLMRYGKKMHKKCEQCQRSFKPWSPTTRFCSAQCYTDSGTRGGPRAAVETAICKWCGKPFERFANRQLKREICNRNCPARPPGPTRNACITSGLR